jgi:hypothetical protein
MTADLELLIATTRDIETTKCIKSPPFYYDIGKKNKKKILSMHSSRTRSHPGGNYKKFLSYS